MKSIKNRRHQRISHPDDKPQAAMVAEMPMPHTHEEDITDECSPPAPLATLVRCTLHSHAAHFRRKQKAAEVAQKEAQSTAERRASLDQYNAAKNQYEQLKFSAHSLGLSLREMAKRLLTLQKSSLNTINAFLECSIAVHECTAMDQNSISK